jgi:hypothetical protein
MILNGVEVVCFDTLLQVLILKEMEEGSGIGASGTIRVHPRGDGKYEQRAENGGDIDVTWRI